MNGVNTLAFRMCQNDAFYKVDADCVGLMADNIPWKLNRQWLDLVSKSGSPLFVSMQPSVITPEIFEDLKKAFKINSVQENTAEPLDWMYNNQPQKWLIDGEKAEYDFVMDSPPRLLGYKIGDLSSTNMF
jgi:alpha-galactosidase